MLEDDNNQINLPRQHRSNLHHDNSKIRTENSFITTTDRFWIIITFTKSTKTYSFQIPLDWTFSKLIRFIEYTFDEEITYYTPSYIYKGKKISKQLYQTPLTELFTTTNTNYILVLSQPATQSSDNNLKTYKDIITSNEFITAENNMFESYLYSMNKTTNNSFSLNSFPLMHYSITQRVKHIYDNNAFRRYGSLKPQKIENYPFRDYFKLALILRILITFFLFAFNLKGYYAIMLLCMFVAYYWYSVHILVDQFYEQKKEEIKFTEEEKKAVEGFLQNLISDYANIENKNEEAKGNKVFDQFELENGSLLKMQKDLVEMQQRQGNPDMKMPEMEGIDKLIMSKVEENKRSQQQEEREIGMFRICLKIVYTYFLTLIPNLCDKFEQENPFPNENNEQQPNEGEGNNANRNVQEGEGNNGERNENDEQQQNNNINNNNNNNVEQNVPQMHEQQQDNQ